MTTIATMPTLTDVQARVLADMRRKADHGEGATPLLSTIGEWVREIGTLHELGLVSRWPNGRGRVWITQRGRIALSWHEEQRESPRRIGP